MSLVITSNVNLEDVNTQSNIFKPYSYTTSLASKDQLLTYLAAIDLMAPCWICHQNQSSDSPKMPPHPYELHFVTPPCSPKRRGSPPSCDPDSGVPLYPPPSLNRNPRLPSPSSTSSFATARNFSTSDLSELYGN